MKKIVFIDDEPFYCKQYFRNLEAHFDSRYNLHLCTRAEEGLRYITDHNEVALVILDIMMPPPPDIDEELTEQGKNTGVWMLGQIRDTAVRRDMKIFLLSNRGVDDLQKEVQRIQFPKDLIQIGHKPQISAQQLPMRVHAFLDRPVARL